MTKVLQRATKPFISNFMDSRAIHIIEMPSLSPEMLKLRKKLPWKYFE